MVSLAVIELAHVTVRYPGHPAVVALNDLSLRLRPGITLIHGPSGAGKSTLLRLLATLEPPDEGTVRYPWSNRPEGLAGLRARIGYVPQENRLTNALACGDALRYLAAVRGLAGVADLLARWGLEPVRGKRLDRLSAGESRRWLLAQSRLADPDLWLLDEPLRALDAWAVQTLRAELARYALAAAHGALRYAVVVAHDPRLDDLANAAIHLDRGRTIPL